MANQEHLHILKQGAAQWHRWRRECPWEKPDLRGANLSGAELRASYLSGADLSDAILTRADLRRADLRDADLSRADLTRADLIGADLGGVNLSSADLPRADLRGAYLVSASIHGAKLIGADLRGAYLADVEFSDTDLANAVLSGADLSHAILSGANLRYAYLSEAILNGANLSNANLNGANLIGASICGADLSGADLTHARVAYTVFADVDLSKVKHLDKTIQEGPATIGIDTLYRSKGKIPEAFLRGAGVPHRFDECARALVDQPIQFYSCFNIYAHEDKQFCEKLDADLRAREVRVWTLPEGTKLGSGKWGKRGQIGRPLRRYDRLVVVCSEHSLQSEAVLQEIELALQREKDERRLILFPVQLDDHIAEQWEHQHSKAVLARVVADFRGWDSDSLRYQTQFEKLLDALNGETAL